MQSGLLITSGTPDSEAAFLKEKLRILRHASTPIASSLDFRQILANTISACLPALGDFGFFDVRTENSVIRTTRAFNDPDTEALLLPTQWVRQEREDMNLCALSTGRHALYNHIDDHWYRQVAVNEAHLDLLRRLAFC